MESIRIGFVGLGGICRQRHIPGFQKIGDVELVAVANQHRASSEQAAKDFHIPRICDSWEELVAMDDLDAIVIGTWPYLHHPVSIAALNQGKHVFCQARMAMNYAQAQEMHAAAQDADKVTMLCPVPIGLSIDQTIARLLREETLGDIHLVCVQSFSDAWTNPDTSVTWRKDHRLSGLNMHTLGMYAEVLHRWFGPTRSVCAHADTFTPARKDANGDLVDIQIPDQLLFHATMPNNITAQYTLSTAVKFGRDTIDIYGTKASLHYDVVDDLLFFRGDGYDLETVPIFPEDAYDVTNWRVEADFIHAIRNNRPYHPNFEDGLRYMQVVQAVHDSAQQQHPITLP